MVLQPTHPTPQSTPSFHHLPRGSLARHFAMARGGQHPVEERGLELRKWFNTNYHYLVRTCAYVHVATRVSLMCRYTHPHHLIAPPML